MKLYKDLFRFFLIMLISFKVCIFKASAGELRPTNLSCNYKNNPIGIDSKKPVLGWIIVSGQRGIKQTAYQVLVSDRLDELKKGKGDIWNTGKINSTNSIHVSFSGKELQSAKKYYWQVRIWDNKGNVSGWSEPATWQMGLLTPTDWKGASWIAYDELPASKKIVPAAHLGGKKDWGLLKDTLPLLRREFTVEKPLEQAIIFISGLGHFELSINGKKIGDHFLDPGWTNYNQHALYIGFDLTNEIKTGKNALGVMLGNGFYHVPAERYRKLTGTFGHPKMVCHLILKYKDGTSEDVVSNQMWKAAPGPVTFSSIFGGEDYDATLEQEGWNFPSFNDSAWKKALLVKGPYKLNSQEAEPLKVMETFTPVKISQPKPGIWVYDLGQNFSGIPAISVKGKRGDTIKIMPGEILDSNNVVSQRPSGGPAWFTYILRGEGAES